MLSDVNSVECLEKSQLEVSSRCLLAWPIKLVCEVEKSKDKPVHFDTCGRGHWLEPTETDRYKLAVKIDCNKALKVAALSN